MIVLAIDTAGPGCYAALYDWRERPCSALPVRRSAVVMPSG